jgi:hypothetical protein
MLTPNDLYSIDDLVDRIRAFGERYSALGKLFAWIFTAALAQLDNGLRRARQRAHPPPTSAAEAAGREPTRWAFVLQNLITASGNVPQRWREAGSYDCGHQPRHSSASGRCLSAEPESAADGLVRGILSPDLRHA